jgi:hypothetical protein
LTFRTCHHNAALPARFLPGYVALPWAPKPVREQTLWSHINEQ